MAVETTLNSMNAPETKLAELKWCRYLEEILSFPWFHVDLTLMDIVNVAEIWK